MDIQTKIYEKVKWLVGANSEMRYTRASKKRKGETMFLEIQNIQKSFGQGDNRVAVLRRS